MKFFTPEKFVALQDFSSDHIMDAADAGWEDAVDRYDGYFRSVEPLLPPEYRRFNDQYYLHDALVLYMAQQKDRFVIVLQLDAPPRPVLQLTYALADPATIDRDALPADHRGTGHAVAWLHDEVELVSKSPLVCAHSILFSNGWEVRLPFRELFVQEVQPLIISNGHVESKYLSVLTPTSI